MSAAHPTVYVVAGPNGAGKTTFAMEFLPKTVHCQEFLNADLIAAGLSPFSAERQNIRAGRLLLERVRECAEQRIDFGFETTLSGRTYALLLRQLRATGYRVVLSFLWLPNAEMAVKRVANRVRQGGHSVPEVDIRRRWDSGLRNLNDLYQPLADEISLYDSTRNPLLLIARRVNSDLEVFDQLKYRLVMPSSSR